jgi:predicted aspartyl protease
MAGCYAGRVRRPLLALALAMLAVPAGACAPARGSGASEPKPRLATVTPDVGPRPPPTRRQKLDYEIRGRSFPLPLVQGTVAGQPALFLVDTGANSHVIAGWLARKLGLPMKKLGDIGTDHVGKTITAFRIDKPDVALSEWGPLAPGPVLAAEVPDVIERLGIGGFISPQRLVEDGDSVVLDLAGAELRAALWDEALYSLSASGTTLLVADQARACEEKEGPIKGLAFVVPATIESHRVDLLVDTGAQHSDLFVGSSAGQKLAAQSIVNKEPMYTASGKISARKIMHARVGSGAFTVTSDVDLIVGAADASCPRDGVLAMDVLRSCALLLGRSRVYGRCREPKK